ncbi:MAG: T9SS type A sorting domain-containing protein [Bacteroidia bacterium]|nr:T9SS type A sorting domain-containing protein [Bacteroidia bacterium]
MPFLKQILLSILIFFAIGLNAEVLNISATDSVWVKVVLRTDNNSNETSWNLFDRYDNQILTNGNLVHDSVYLDSVYLPKDSCYLFQIKDANANGINAPGYFQLYIDGTLIVQENDFNQQGDYFINCQEGESCLRPNNLAAEGFFYAGFERNWYTFSPDSSGIYTFSTCGLVGCDTRLWLYDRCPNYLFDGAEGALAYNDNKCLLEAEISTYLQKDSLYYIRLEDWQESCSGGMFYTITAAPNREGCLDTLACNYDPLANIDNGTCAYYPSTICYPDLVVDQTEMDTSFVVDSIEVLGDDLCLLEEGCVSGFGMRDVIKFGTRIYNQGATDFYLGNPRDNPDEFSNENCHGHFHYEGYSDYLLFDKYGLKIPIGFKNGFCLMDTECDVSLPKFNCQTQGVSASCNDLYDVNTECQWIDITDLPDGEYTLANRINPLKRPDALGRVESDFENNWAQTCIKINRTNNVLSVSKLIDCDPYVDCEGAKYGDAELDCNGQCNGTAIYGDSYKDESLNSLDLENLLSKCLDENTIALNCLDLNRDFKISLQDAFLLNKCLDYTDSFEYNHDHPDCVFPKRKIVSEKEIFVTIDSVNSDSNYLILAVNTYGNWVSGIQVNLEGITVKSAVSLEFGIPVIYDENSVQLYLTTLDSFQSTQNLALVKVYFAPRGDTLRMSSINQTINNKGELLKLATGLEYFIFENVGIEKKITTSGLIKIFPNPSSNKCTFKVHPSLKNATIKVSNSTGQTVLNYHGIGVHLVNTSEFENGIYFVEVSNKSIKETTKLIVIN